MYTKIALCACVCELVSVFECVIVCACECVCLCGCVFTHVCIYMCLIKAPFVYICVRLRHHLESNLHRICPEAYDISLQFITHIRIYSK